MRVYLAASGSPMFGNIYSFWENAMKLYLAGTYSRKYCLKESMKIFLAGNAPWRGNGIYDSTIIKHKPYILESYYYLKDDDKWYSQMKPFFSKFLLDSGAFTFMQDKNNTTNWDKYVEEYAKFINKHDIKLFFELDIDSVVGLKEVERLRAKLEKLTNKKCIPVWHKSRGKENWLRLIKDYDYVAIGGIVSKEIKRREFHFLTWFLNEAKKENCKVHGLGFTNLKGMRKYSFYSVDSTAWLHGNKGGYIYKFNGRKMKQIKPQGKKLKGRPAALHNFQEWIKFQQYADRYL